MTKANTRRPRSLVSYLVLAAIALAIYLPVFGIRPLDGDNLYALAWVNHASLPELLIGDAGIYPEWRPLPYLTVWAESRAGLDAVPFHFLVNVALWACCAWLVWLIVLELSGAMLPAAVASLWLVADRRAIDSLSWIIERQTSMACAAGLAAILMIVRLRDRRPATGEAAAIGAALLASAFSKEYGLAFAAAVAFGALSQRRREILVVAVAAMVVYVIARFALAAGAFGAYCEDMGYFTSIATTCVEPVAGIGVSQMIYNAVATVVGTLVPGLLAPEGMLQVDRWRALVSLAVLLVAAWGCYKGGPIVWMIALLPLLNGALNFMVYRDRNHVIGACAIAIAAGIGLAALQRLPRRGAVGALPAVTAVLVMVMLAARIAEARQVASAAYHEQTDGVEPCESEVRRRPFADPYVRLVKAHYGMANPTCE
jgi:hypothetical protein